MRKFLVVVCDVTQMSEERFEAMTDAIRYKAEDSAGVLTGSAAVAGDDVQYVGLFTQGDEVLEVGVVVKPAGIPVLDLSGGR